MGSMKTSILSAERVEKHCSVNGGDFRELSLGIESETDFEAFI